MYLTWSNLEWTEQVVYLISQVLAHHDSFLNKNHRFRYTKFLSANLFVCLFDV